MTIGLLVKNQSKQENAADYSPKTCLPKLAAVVVFLTYPLYRVIFVQRTQMDRAKLTGLLVSGSSSGFRKKTLIFLSTPNGGLAVNQTGELCPRASIDIFGRPGVIIPEVEFGRPNQRTVRSGVNTKLERKEMSEQELIKHEQWIAEQCDLLQWDERKLVAQASRTAINSARADEDVLAYYAETCHIAA